MFQVVKFAKCLLVPSNRRCFDYCAVLSLAYLLIGGAPTVGAANSGGDTGADPNASPLTLVFSDDFSTNPNTNGLWTIHRYANDPNTEASWDGAKQAWDLVRPATSRGVAVFANYDLTATTWRAEFRYRVGNLGGLKQGGDGFVFMFYKNKAAYGIPASGYQKGFELSNGTDVRGYGLQFDNYLQTCDPSSTDYYAIIKDNVCTILGGLEFDWIGDNNWHLVQVAFAEGGIRITIDGETTTDSQIEDPDYSFSGIGFSAGTGSAYGTYEIDNFRLWVAE